MELSKLKHTLQALFGWHTSEPEHQNRTVVTVVTRRVRINDMPMRDYTTKQEKRYL